MKLIAGLLFILVALVSGARADIVSTDFQVAAVTLQPT
jgi:hypothetical protein